MYKRVNDVRVKCFLSRVKFEPNFMLFCRKSELCCDLALFGVIFLAHLGNWCQFFSILKNYFGLLGLLRCYANSVLSQSRHFFQIKLLLHKPCLCKKVVVLHIWEEPPSPYECLSQSSLQLQHKSTCMCSTGSPFFQHVWV